MDKALRNLFEKDFSLGPVPKAVREQVRKTSPCFRLNFKIESIDYGQWGDAKSPYFYDQLYQLLFSTERKMLISSLLASPEKFL